MPIFNALCVGVGSVTSLCFHSQLLTNDSVTNCTSSFALYNCSPRNFNPLNLSQKSRINKYPLQATEINASSEPKVDEILNDSHLPSQPSRLSPKPADWQEARRYKQTGSIYWGRVEGFNNGGMLVRFSSLVGFVPFPQLSPSRCCKEPNKTIQEIARDLVGSVIPVKVVKANEELKKLVLSEKEAIWAKYSGKINAGDVFDARVGLVEDYGAFVHLRFRDGNYYLTGLVHISEVSWDYVQDVRDILKEGDNVRVKVININREKSRISLSIRQLEDDPLFETLDKVIPPQDGATSPDSETTDESYNIQPLPGLQEILNELLEEDGISEARITRQGFEKRVVSQDLQLWLSNASAVDNQFIILARAGREVQEIKLMTTLDQDGIKKALRRVLERVP